MEHKVIALDLMGGDFAPAQPLEAAWQALEHYPDIRLLLVGPRAVIAEAVAPAALQGRIEFCHAEQVIGMDDPPVQSVRQKPDASLVAGVRQLAEGRAGAFVTAGNSGAAVVAGIRLLQTLTGIERPALAVLFPGQQGETVLLDVGSQVQCRPRHLVQFARMGAALSRHALGVENPRIGLLNVGEEPGKGHVLARESWRRLSESGLNFVGNIEGWDLPRSRVDVAVCDGFTGNVVLKLAEGLSEFFMAVYPPLAKLPGTRHFQYIEHGGSLVLGVDGLVIITHGRAQSAAIVNAIGLARRTLLGRTIEQMQAEFKQKEDENDRKDKRNPDGQHPGEPG